MRRNTDIKCPGYWLIDSQNTGECLKLQPDEDLTDCVCGETGKPCPYDGVRDFEKLQPKGMKGIRDMMLERRR